MTLYMNLETVGDRLLISDSLSGMIYSTPFPREHLTISGDNFSFTAGERPYCHLVGWDQGCCPMWIAALHNRELTCPSHQ